MINRHRTIARSIIAAVLGVALLTSCATEPDAPPPPAETVGQPLAQATCAWWDRLIGVLLPVETVRCAILDGADGFWRALAEFYFRRANGWTVSAHLLEHSLDSSPTTITNDPDLIAKLKQASELTSFFRNLPVGHYVNGDLELPLTSNDDLFFAIHLASGTFTGDRTATSSNFQVTVHDRYDFGDNKVGNLAVRLGVALAQISQFIGVITPYDINASFTFTATYAAPPPPDPCASAGDGLYCGGSRQGGFTGGNTQTLFHCVGHHTTQRTTCSTSCVIAPAGHPDFCATDPCTNAANGLFCWNSTQGGFTGLGLQNNLYTCSAGHTTQHTACSNGCTIAPPGVPDHCTASSCSNLTCGTHCCGANAQFCGANNACCDGITCTANCPC